MMKQKKRIEEAKERQQKFKDNERKKKADFHSQIEIRISKLLQSSDTKLEFEPMNKLQRSIVHEFVDTAGLVAHSFGEEEIDRHLIVWKKEHVPCDAELDALRKGEEYNPQNIVLEESRTEETNSEASGSRKRKVKPEKQEQEKYFEKYAKIVGGSSGLDAAQITKTNTTYGMVPSRNKEDTRSIEETMNQIREKKKLQKTIEVLDESEGKDIPASSITSLQSVNKLPEISEEESKL